MTIHNLYVVDSLYPVRPETEKEFTKLYNDYFIGLTYYAYQYLNDKERALDIVQDSFIKMWNIRDRLFEVKSIRAYLYRTVHNMCLNELVLNQAHQKRLAKYDCTDDEFDEPVDQKIIRAEVYSKLYKMVDELPLVFLDVIQLYYFKTKSIHEIAKLLQIPLNTVKSRRYKALNHLQKRLSSLLVLFVVIVKLIF